MKQMFKYLLKHNLFKMKFLLFLVLLIFSGCKIVEDNIDISVTEKDIIDVEIRNSEINPSNIVIAKGSSVKWTNYDSQGHTITIENYLDSKTILPGESFIYTFNDIGEYEYFCKIHNSIEGIVIVN